MNSKNPSSFEPKPFSKEWFLEGVKFIVGLTGFGLFFEICALVSYPILIGMDVFRSFLLPSMITEPIIPITQLSLNSWPSSVLGVLSLPFIDPPNSFFAFAWAMTLITQITTWFLIDIKDLPKRSRKGVSRKTLMIRQIKLKLKLFFLATLILFLLSTPGLRSFEILSGTNLCQRGIFDLKFQCLDLNQLNMVRFHKYGKANSYIAWNLNFSNDMIYTLKGPPSVITLERLLSFPNVTSNVRVEAGRIYPIQ